MLTSFYESIVADQDREKEITKRKDQVEPNVKYVEEIDKTSKLFPKTDIFYNTAIFVPTFEYKKNDTVVEDKNEDIPKSEKVAKSTKTRVPRSTKTTKPSTKIIKKIDTKKENIDEYMEIIESIPAKKIISMEEPLMFSFCDIPTTSDIKMEKKIQPKIDLDDLEIIGDAEVSVLLKDTEKNIAPKKKYATITLKNGKKLISQFIVSEDLEFIYTPSDKINRKTIDNIRYI